MIPRRCESARRTFFCVVVAFLGTNVSSAATLSEREAAVERGIKFLYVTASNNENLARYGSDLLWCFYSISHTSRGGQLSANAGRMGRDLAVRWRGLHKHVAPDAGALEIYNMILGAYSADRLGVHDPGFKNELRHAARKFTANDYLGFEAPHEPPRLDDPRRYDVFTDALIRSYFGDAFGIPLGAHYRDVARWLPRLRPYSGYDHDTEFDIFYAITHFIYTVNGYNERRVAPSLIPEEIAFLRKKLDAAIGDQDPEMVGEAVDCLKAAGYENDPQVLKGMEYLLSSQRPDGGWSDKQDGVYTDYHSAWTAIDGLRDYRFHGEVRKLPLN